MGCPEIGCATYREFDTHGRNALVSEQVRMLRALRSPLFFPILRALPASVLWLSALVLPACAAPAPSTPDAPPLLPTDFAGWSLVSPVQDSAVPEAADAANAAVLKEYGFQQFASAHYANGDNKLSVRAIRFQDASGAFGAFTFFRRPGSIQEQIGRTAAWDGSHVLFWTGATLIDATLDHVTPMSPAELRELAKDLPQASGSANVAPPLPGYLPRQDLDIGLSHYSLGPQAYQRGGGVLPVALVDFASSSAEAITADYSTRDGDGQVTLLMYPTPQLAAARLRDIDAFLKAGNTQSTWPQALAESHPGSLLTRRSGPLVAVVSGSLPPATAHKLLNQINYQADVVWNNPQGYISDGSKVARLILGIFALTGILGGAALLLGLFLGGGRALVRVLRGKPASAFQEETEFIRLNLKD
jgi:hypothetical protein